MQVTDLTDQYFEHYIKNSSAESYFKFYPQLFKHYFSVWTDKNIPLVKLNKKQISNSKNLIKDQLILIEENFSTNNLSLENYEIIMFVGVGTTNGHAFYDNNQFKIWIPIESYTTELYTKIFLTHEIIHALHYTNEPSFYFNTLVEKNKIGRQLITEGIATYLTHEILKVSLAESLWADYLSSEKFNNWEVACINNLSELKNIVAGNFDSENPDLGIFYANDPDDIFKYRSGYYLGYKIIEDMFEKQKLSYSSLLKKSKEEMYSNVKEYL